jgi:hypothetical protein
MRHMREVARGSLERAVQHALALIIKIAGRAFEIIHFPVR